MIVAFLAKWGLSWLTGPMGKGIAIGAVLLVSVTFIQRAAVAGCRADQLEATLKETQGQLVTANEIARTARGKADAAETRADELETLTNEIIAENLDSCNISDSVRERLRAIE